MTGFHEASHIKGNRIWLWDIERQVLQGYWVSWMKKWVMGHPIYRSRFVVTEDDNAATVMVKKLSFKAEWELYAYFGC